MTYRNNGALWKRQTKNGNLYYSFKASRDIKEGESFNFFSNRFKKEDKHPDFVSADKIEDNKPTVEF